MIIWCLYDIIGIATLFVIFTIYFYSKATAANNIINYNKDDNIHKSEALK